MGTVKRNRTFLVGVVMVLVVGALLFGGVVAVRVMAESGAAPTPAATQPASYNTVSSYGMTGYAPLTIEPTAALRRRPRDRAPDQACPPAAGEIHQEARADDR